MLRRSRGRPAAFRVALVSMAAATVAGVVGIASPPQVQAGPPPSGLPWLTVAHPSGSRAQMVDPAGRTVILRGVNLVGLEDDYYPGSTTDGGRTYKPAPYLPINPADYAGGGCPGNSHAISEPPVCEVQAGLPEYQQSSGPDSRNDLAQMRSLGFDVVRLAVSWSQLEPQPGRYNTTYLQRIQQVVNWAGQQGIYVLVDMHQDAYSRFTPANAPLSAPPLVSGTAESGNHADGAPPWAVVADGVPPEAADGQAELNAYVAEAFNSFWLNRVPTDPATGQPLPQGSAPGQGLQDHYIGAMVQLARLFKSSSTVVGYEIMNEPLPGTISPGVFDQGYLLPFYRRVIDAITGTGDGVPCPPSISYSAACGYPDQGVHDTRHLFFFEPMAARNLTDFAVGASAPFSTYPNLVYAPHVYTHVFTAETSLPGAAGGVYPLSWDQAFQTADAEARLLGSALFIGEYGNSNGQDDSILAPETAAQDRAMVGSTLWQWKMNCGPGQTDAQCQPGLWAVYHADPADQPAQNLGLIPSRGKYLARAWPRATAGSLQGYTYDPATGVFEMTATSAASPEGGRDRDTIVFAPRGLVPGSLVVGGAAHPAGQVDEPDGTVLVYVAPTGMGAYSVRFTVAPPA